MEKAHLTTYKLEGHSLLVLKSVVYNLKLFVWRNKFPKLIIILQSLKFLLAIRSTGFQYDCLIIYGI